MKDSAPRAPIEKLLPTQLYISRAKLRTVQYALDCGGELALGPIPVLPWGPRFLMLDGHTRALALCQQGYSELLIRCEEVPVDLDMYSLCLAWCQQQGVRTVRDLLRHVIEHTQFETLWITRCERAYQAMSLSRS
ncbi:MAG: hypothetical protein CVV27_09060 [Candidatus Melainabacteria bacterium HGW-Melainabacteria-1]|nr:MAG: hypothetical protein CVV27_09060 [Candidatus Melainabacteria bacterium HGW-Melainabacteria-1]